MATVLNIVDLSERTADQVAAAVRSSGPEFVIEVPLPSVDHSQGYLDVKTDALRALYVGEALRPYCDRISQTWFERREQTVWDERRPYVSAHFAVRPKDAAGFAAALYEAAHTFGDEDLPDLLDGFAGSVDGRAVALQAYCPQLLEDYREYARLAEQEGDD